MQLVLITSATCINYCKTCRSNLASFPIGIHIQVVSSGFSSQLAEARLFLSSLKWITPDEDPRQECRNAGPLNCTFF